MSEQPRCFCPHIDGYRIRGKFCGVHGEEDRRVLAEIEATPSAPVPEKQWTEDEVDMFAAWADYRKDYGVSASDMSAAHKAFKAGWLAARQGDQSGVLR